MSTPIFLIGYMGCGKSTLGRALARRTGMDFIDLDDYIENRYRRSVKQLFALHGEEGFRLLEQRMLDEVSCFEDVIVACGGGTPCFFDNMQKICSRGTAVWLRSSMPTLVRRLSRAKGKRPLIAALDDDQLAAFIADALEQRAPYYSQAPLRFDTDSLEDAGQIEATVDRFIALVMPGTAPSHQHATPTHRP